VTVNVGPQQTTISVKPLALGGSAQNPPAWSIEPPPGAVAAMWHHVQLPSGRPFPSFSGYHRLSFLAPAGEPVRGTWQASENPAKGITLTGARWPQRANVTANVPKDQSTIVDLAISGTLRGARVQIAAPGSRTMIVDADSLRTPFLAVPYIGESYTVSLVTPPNARGRMTFGADVRAATPIGDALLFRIPGAAVLMRARPRMTGGTVIASYWLTAQNNLQPAQFDTLGVPVNSAQGLVLHLRKLSANNPGGAVITAFYDSWANSAPTKIAEVVVGSKPADYDLAVPLAPFTETVAFSVLPVDDPRMTLALGAATLSDSDPLAGGTLVSVPAVQARGGAAIANDDSRIERIPYRNARGSYVVGDFTYDPAWTIGARPHWQVNGYANAWRAGGSGVMTYGLQGLYRGLLVAGALLWLAAIAAFVFLHTKRRRVGLPQDS